MLKTRSYSGFTSLMAAMTLLAGSSAFAEKLSFKAELSTANEVPPVADNGKGTLSGTFDTESKVLSYAVEYSGLSGPVTAAHFHGPSDGSHNGPVMIPFSGSYASPMKDSATLTDPQVSDLMAGQLYSTFTRPRTNPVKSAAQVMKAN